ncbi:uncharacterized protein LOC101853919 [Aplysia californica]|uniref:Uncharacterized protein LOC101853919 n=1 Tax=Aplysia californica TaxID=6500 RepID=A0ABM1VQH3_APLCA|nr:uncharacterized protein LOC101853919 [Aplysia californica]
MDVVNDVNIISAYVMGAGMIVDTSRYDGNIPLRLYTWQTHLVAIMADSHETVHYLTVNNAITSPTSWHVIQWLYNPSMEEWCLAVNDTFNCMPLDLSAGAVMLSPDMYRIGSPFVPGIQSFSGRISCLTVFTTDYFGTLEHETILGKSYAATQDYCNHNNEPGADAIGCLKVASNGTTSSQVSTFAPGSTFTASSTPAWVFLERRGQGISSPKWSRMYQ